MGSVLQSSWGLGVLLSSAAYGLLYNHIGCAPAPAVLRASASRAGDNALGDEPPGMLARRQNDALMQLLPCEKLTNHIAALAREVAPIELYEPALVCDAPKKIDCARLVRRFRHLTKPARLDGIDEDASAAALLASGPNAVSTRAWSATTRVHRNMPDRGRSRRRCGRPPDRRPGGRGSDPNRTAQRPAPDPPQVPGPGRPEGDGQVRTRREGDRRVEADRCAEEATLHYEQVDGRLCGEYTVLIAG